MNLVIENHSFHYEMENLTRIFFPNEKINVTSQRDADENYIFTSLNEGESETEISVKIVLDGNEYKDLRHFSPENKKENETAENYYERKMAIMLYGILSKATSYDSPWGILTGVRPAKLMTNLLYSIGEKEATDYFRNELKVSEDKTKLALMVAKTQIPITAKSMANSFSLYISIPFCPTRCSYCSFISHSNESAKKLIPKYVELLCKEIEATADVARNLGLNLESIYMGGGTPTVLSAPQLKMVTDAISANFNISGVEEYTIEAGRPDSITEDKLKVIHDCGCTRISINPQTFNDSVLKEIGRNHTSLMTENAMQLARDNEFFNINMDLIAGLPTDTLESFENSLNKALKLYPENITVHTLALKRSSNIVTESRDTNSPELCAKMLDYAFKTLTDEGYIPYYMYRQSKCLGNLENVGWARKGFEGQYNIFMMEECHTVLSVGAGGVTRLKAPFSGEIDRVFNYKYPYEYINSFDEILARKEKIAEFYKNHKKR